MPTFEVSCRHPDGREYVELVEASTLDIAKIKTRNSGKTVVGFEDDEVEPAKADAQQPDESWIVPLSFFVPLIGILIGSIRAGTNRQGGGTIIAASIFGFALWIAGAVIAFKAH